MHPLTWGFERQWDAQVCLCRQYGRFVPKLATPVGQEHAQRADIHRPYPGCEELTLKVRATIREGEELRKGALRTQLTVA